MKDEIQLCTPVRTNKEDSWFHGMIGVVYARNRYGVKVMFPNEHVTNLITFLPWSEVELATESLEFTCNLN